MGKPETSRSEDWKDKYFKALNELDLQERLRAEKLGRLSRDLLAVLERFRGTDAGFDQDLAALARSEQLGDEAQQNRLHSLVTTLERCATTHPDADTSVEGAGTRGTRPAVHLRALLAGLSLPARFHSAFDELKDYLERAAEQADDIDVIAQVAAKLSDILAQPGEERTLVARDALQSLVDHLSLPEAVQARLGALTPQLQRAQDGPTMRKIAKDLADFVVDHVGTMHAELASLGSFLVVIKSRLAEVSGFIVTDDRERGIAATARKDLDTAVQRSLRSLRSTAAESADIERLKHDIQSQIALIDGNVSAYLQSEAARAARQDEQQQACARQLAELESQSARLRRKLADAQDRAARDTLTSLPNRLAFNDRMRLEYARWQRDGRPLTLAVLDIDRFKSINDTWGHQAGDRVLKHLARELSSQTRAQDFFGRYGGEEFVLILPDTRQAGALTLADALRRHIETCRFKFKDAPVDVTISCGIAEFQSGATIDEVFARADAALYAAKENGRNRIEFLDAA